MVKYCLNSQDNQRNTTQEPDITQNASACNGEGSALGALGRRLESCRSDSLKPIHTSELPRLAFLMGELTSFL